MAEAGPFARRHRQIFLAVNALGGIAVLGSYAHGFAAHPDGAGVLWGGVPEGLRPLYTVNMFLAAAGYFAFTGCFLLGVDPTRARVFGRFGFGLVTALYAAVLIPSALWMPLTFAYLEAPSAALWWTIRVVLAVVGLGSLGLLAALLAVRPRPPVPWLAPALLGLASFCLQTAVLDALVWPHHFPH